jgi:hypothetical protein
VEDYSQRHTKKKPRPSSTTALEESSKFAGQTPLKNKKLLQLTGQQSKEQEILQWCWE